MKKILAILLMVAFASISFGASIDGNTVSNSDAIWMSGGLVKTIYDTLKSDSLWGTIAHASNLKIASKLVPEAGWQYILVRDTMGVYGAQSHRTDYKIQVKIRAKSANDSICYGDIVVDTLANSAAPQQIILPFNSKIIGEQYDLLLNNTASTDSAYINHMRIMKRRTVLSNFAKTQTGFSGQ